MILEAPVLERVKAPIARGISPLDQQASLAIAQVIGSREPRSGESVGAVTAADIIAAFKNKLGLKEKTILNSSQKQALLTRLENIGFDISSMSEAGQRTRKQFGIETGAKTAAIVELKTATPNVDRERGEGLAEVKDPS